MRARSQALARRGFSHRWRANLSPSSGQSGSRQIHTAAVCSGRWITRAQGSLLYRGSPLAEMMDLAAYRAHEIGFIFQAFHLLPTFTAVENVQMPMLEMRRSACGTEGTGGRAAPSVGLEKRATSLSLAAFRR